MNDVYLEDLYMEGFMDRMKARTAGIGGGFKGLGNTIAGGVKGAIAGATGNIAGVEAATKQREEGGMKAGYNKAKLQSITNTFQNEMQALFGNDWNTKYPKLADELTTLSQGNVATPAPAPASAATPPPLPELSDREQKEETHKQNLRDVSPDSDKEWISPKTAKSWENQAAKPATKQTSNPNIIDKSTPLKKDQTVTGAGGRLTKGRYKVVNPNANGKVTLRPLSKAGAVYGTKSIDVNREDILEKKQVKFEDTYQRLLEVPTI